jgi:hypothetical protein
MCGRQQAAECLQEAQGERCALMLAQPPANGCPICAMFETTQRSVGPRWHMSAKCVHTFWRAVGTSVLAVCNRPCAVKSATADCPHPPHHHNLPCCAQPSMPRDVSAPSAITPVAFTPGVRTTFPTPAVCSHPPTTCSALPGCHPPSHVSYNGCCQAVDCVPPF